MRASLSIVAVLLLLATLAAPAHARRDRQRSAQDLYEQGLRQMQRGYYTKALESFTRVRNYHRDDPISVKAQLAIADVYFKKHDFEQARYAYEEFAAYHPRHENLDYVTYRIGLSIWRRAPRLAGRDLSSTRAAVNVWTGFDTRFPDSKHIEEVNKHLERERARLAHKELYIARFYARRGAWDAVRGRAEYLLLRYPDTPWADEALYWMGTAMHAWGDTDEAVQVRDRLAEEDSPLLSKLDRRLAKPPGERPDEKVFIRPYRIRGMTPGMGPQ
jgi:outer membrane protein assembly factor BamD